MCSGSAWRFRHGENSVKKSRTVERSAKATHEVSEGWRNGRSSVIRNRAASGEVKLDRDGGSRVGGWSLGAFEISNFGGPDTIRFRKYTAGTHMLLQEIGVET